MEHMTMLHRHGAVLSKGRGELGQVHRVVGLTQLEEGVSLDGMLCPRLLRDVKARLAAHRDRELYAGFLCEL